MQKDGEPPPLAIPRGYFNDFQIPPNSLIISPMELAWKTNISAIPACILHFFSVYLPLYNGVSSKDPGLTPSWGLVRPNEPQDYTLPPPPERLLVYEWEWKPRAREEPSRGAAGALWKRVSGLRSPEFLWPLPQGPEWLQSHFKCCSYAFFSMKKVPKANDWKISNRQKKKKKGIVNPGQTVLSDEGL